MSKPEELPDQVEVIVEKIYPFPKELCCYNCKLLCQDPVQIFCCNEVFCKIHLEEEINQNYICPNCKHSTSLSDFASNKHIEKLIDWYKSFALSDVNNIDKNENKQPEANQELDKSQIELFQKMLEMSKINTSYANFLGIDLNPVIQKQEKEKKSISKERIKDRKRSYSSDSYRSKNRRRNNKRRRSSTISSDSRRRDRSRNRKDKSKRH